MLSLGNVPEVRVMLSGEVDFPISPLTQKEEQEEEGEVVVV